MSNVEQEMRELLKASLAKVKELKAQLASSEEARHEPLAIVGMGCRFPGGASSPARFWELLDEGRDAVQSLAGRWELVGARPSDEAPRWAGLLTGPVDSFDAAFFSISPREALSLDPQHRLLLEVAWEALEDAGVPPLSLHGSRTGVFLGACSSDYLRTVERQPREAQDAYGTTGNMLAVAAGRVSYTLGLQGPCFTVDTACSSSLVAVHLACRSLRARECDVALTGGVNLLLSPASMDAVARSQALATDGRCRTFDASASGLVRGEGCGLVVLKRLGDAQRDGDRILALIRGSAVNQDGRSTGLTAPNVRAQEALLREALANARVEARAVGFVEAHGTGTSLGDPIEVEALRAVVGVPRPDGSRCVLGAVKTNIGHLEAAAGVAGLIKAVLSLRHERIPKNLNFRTLNPRLQLEGTALTLATEALPWPRSAEPRLAGVSSFGVSGTNAHVILEEAPVLEPAPAAPARSAELVVLSARSAGALDAAAGQLHEHLEAHPELQLADVAFSLATTRSAMEHRLAVAATSREGLRQALAAAAAGQTPPGAARGRVSVEGAGKVVFVFPGQGSQWVGMGRKLLDEELVFRDALEACDRAIQKEAGWSLLAELAADEEASRLGRIDVVQPALFALEVALAALWRSWGVEPDAVVGHSMGEVAAAHVAGALSLADAVAIICRRSRLLRRISGQGEMALVELSLAEAEAALKGREDRLSVAVSNSPRSTVVAGEPSALAEVLSALEAKGVFCRRVKVDVASHSPQVDPLREELLAALAGIQPREAAVPMRSTVTGAIVAGPELLASYWADNLRRPVRFAEAVQALLDDGCSLFVEMSPHPILAPAVAELQRAAPGGGVAVGSLRRGQDERAALLEALGTLWVQGHEVACEGLFPAGGRRVPLPAYPWQRERHWLELPSGDAKGARGRAHTGGHPLLGEASTLSTQAGVRLWQTTLDLERLPWLGDHRIQGTAVFPGTGYLEMALASGAEVLGDAPLEITGATLEQALGLAADTPVHVQVVTEEEQPGRLRFQVASLAPGADRGAWRVHCRGTVRRARDAEGSPRVDLGALRARLGAGVATATAYTEQDATWLELGPAFQGLVELWRGDGEALGRVHLPEAAGPLAPYRLHPALLDACLQALSGASKRDGDTAPWLPVEVRSLRLLQRPAGELWCHARSGSDGPERPDRRSSDFLVVDSSGAVVAELSGLVMQRLESPAPRREEDDWFLELAWEPAAVAPPTLTTGRWLLLGEGDGLGAALGAALKAAGHAVLHARAPDSGAAGLRALLSGAFGGQAPTAVVHLGSLDGKSTLDDDAVESALVRGCDSALATVQALSAMGYRDAPRLWLLTRGAQAAGGGEVAVAQASMLGLGRTIAMEHADLRCCRVDLDPARPDDEAEGLLAELLADDAEDEVAFRGGERRVARLSRRAPAPGRRERREPAGERPFRLEIDKPGELDDLVLRAAERRAPGPGEVEIEVEAAGLGFIDVMKAKGTYPGLGDGPGALGAECAGRVVAVGPGVSGLGVGQEVLALVPFGFSTHVTVDAKRVALRPAALTAAQAAAIPGAVVTAWYALVHLARLRAGERVLIHSATGGVGLAAVQIARHLGAEIFATAGRPEKRAWLRDQGVAQVMDSRSLDFAEEVLAATGGEGVDVVLHSLSGAAIEASLSTLAVDGRFIELGKTDSHAGRPLGLARLQKSLSYSAVDLAVLAERRPERFAALLHEVVGLFEEGALRPPPVEIFPISRAADALRKMEQGRHIGKMVLTLHEPEAPILVRAEPGAAIRRDGSYLVTGGLGRLGPSVAGWLAAQGAGHVVLMGRSGAQSPEQRAAVAALKAQGARVTVATADVAERSQVERVLREIAASGMPLRGVIHAAAVLDNGPLLEQTPARFRAVMAAKARGALHLHQLTRTLPLDFFVLYASSSGLLGAPEQSNDAAANTFLDALAQQRRREGLPGLSIDWGSFSEVDQAAAQEDGGRRLASRGMRSMTPAEGLSALARLLEGDLAQAGVVPIDLRQWIEFYPAVSASRMLSRLLAEQRPSAGRPAEDRALLERIAAAKPADQTALLLGSLQAHASQVLRIPPGKLDADVPLTSLGMDSLMGLELRNRIENALGIEVPATLLWTYPTVTSLSSHLLGQLALPGHEQAAPPPELSDEPPRDVEAVKLDEDDLFALLNDSLARAETKVSL